MTASQDALALSPTIAALPNIDYNPVFDDVVSVIRRRRHVGVVRQDAEHSPDLKQRLIHTLTRPRSDNRGGGQPVADSIDVPQGSDSVHFAFTTMPVRTKT